MGAFCAPQMKGRNIGEKKQNVFKYFWLQYFYSFYYYVIHSSNIHIVQIPYTVVIPVCHSTTEKLTIQFQTWLTPQLTVLKMLLALVSANCKQLNYREFQGNGIWNQFQKYSGKAERTEPQSWFTVSSGARHAPSSNGEERGVNLGVLSAHRDTGI